MKKILIAILLLFVLSACQAQAEPDVEPTADPAALRASDPTAFVRASGEVQFVEFFAFW